MYMINIYVGLVQLDPTFDFETEVPEDAKDLVRERLEALGYDTEGNIIKKKPRN